MWRLGLELHMKHRLGLMAFLENVPMLKDSRSVRKEDLLGIPYHVYGMGLVIRW
jgi:hypothetical protein